MKVSPMEVTLVGHYGDDLLVVNAARVSFHKFHDEFTEGDTKLVGYLARENHFVPFCHPHATFRVKAPIFVARQLVKHQVGLCLHGDTEVTFIRHAWGASNGKSKVKIRDLYRMWDGQVKYQGGEKGKYNVRLRRIRVFNEETQRFEVDTINNVMFSGPKDCFQLTDQFGNTVIASQEHPFLTHRGWVEVKDLQVGDFLIRDDVGDTFGYSPPVARGKDRWLRNTVRAKATECCVCGATDNLEVDHIIPVRIAPELATDLSNVQVLCCTCHAEKSAAEKQSIAATTLLPKYSRLVAIDYVGEHDCYDLSIENVHNFMANGFVVHNCWSEVSRRYVDDEPEFWFPEVWRQRPDGSIKQGAGGPLTKSESYNRYQDLEYVCQLAVDTYNKMIKVGVAPEQARMVLPLNTMTEWVWTGSLMAWARVCKLRLDSHAQAETAEVARMIDKEMASLFPTSWRELMK